MSRRVTYHYNNLATWWSDYFELELLIHADSSEGMMH
eukprot:COSAG06_NODE_67450_length_252_cov_0.496732_2_plen_36_part_01